MDARVSHVCPLTRESQLCESLCESVSFGVYVHNGQDILNRAQALQLWHRVNLGTVLASQPDLGARQMAILTCVYLEAGPHTVRSLASRLRVTKAVITRALNTLGRYGFVDRGPDPMDKRSVLVRRTANGSRYLADFAERIRFEAQTLKTPKQSSHVA